MVEEENMSLSQHIEETEKEMKVLKKEIKRLEDVVDKFKKYHNNWRNYKSQLGLGDED
jgi:peptidoglycan hydrolase CwlO-like protein